MIMLLVLFLAPILTYLALVWRDAEAPLDLRIAPLPMVVVRTRAGLWQTHSCGHSLGLRKGDVLTFETREFTEDSEWVVTAKERCPCGIKIRIHLYSPNFRKAGVEFL